MKSKIHIISIIVYIFTLSFLVAQETYFDEIAKNYPNSAILRIKDGKIDSSKIVYRKNIELFPEVIVPPDSGYEGDYLVFLPDVKKISLLRIYAFRVEGGKVSIYKTKEPIFLLDEKERSEVSKAVVERIIDLDQLVKRLEEIHMP